MNGTVQSTSSHNPTPGWVAEAHDRFREDLRRDGAAKSTQNDYPRRAQQFVVYALTTWGADPARWPIDAPEQWYLARGWGPGQTYRNLATSSLRAAIRWGSGQPDGGFRIPDVQFPPSVAPPKRERKALAGAEMDSTQNPAPDGAAPDAPTVSAVPPTPPTSVAPAAPAVPGYVAPSPDVSPGATDRPLARARTVDKRQVVARNSLGALLPPGGKLKVYRVSDGTDNGYPGERVLFSEPTEKDTRGYNDIAVWVKDFIHDVKPPLTGPRTLNTIYIVEQYDDQERLLPPPRRVTLSNSGASAGMGTPRVPGVPEGLAPDAPRPGGLVDEVMKSFIKRAERYDTWQEEQLRTHQEVVERTRAGDVNGAQMQWLLAQRPAPVDIKALVEDVVAKVSDIVSKAKEAPLPLPGLLPAPTPAKDPFESPLLSKLVDAATRKDAPLPPPAAPDPVAQFAAIANIVRPPVDPAVSALQSKVEMLTNELRDAKTKDPSRDPMYLFTMMKMADDMVDRRMQRFGGGGSSVGEALTAAITTLPEVIKTLADGSGPPMQAKPGRPGAEQPKKAAPAPAVPTPSAAAPAAPPPPTEDQVKAFRNFTEAAAKGDDAVALNALLAFIVANAKAPAPWPDLNKELAQAISQEIATVDELGYLVQRLYTLPAFNGALLMREFPGVVRKATDILAWNFSVICTRLGLQPRELAGVEPVEAPKAEPPKPEPVAPAAPAGPEGETETEDEPGTDEPETDEAPKAAEG